MGSFRTVFFSVFGVLLFGCGSVGQRLDTVKTPMMGDSSAPHVLVVFSDFECPFCKSAARSLKALSKAHPRNAAIYFKHFPLPQHRMAEKAAFAAEAAHRQGKFWQMHDMIFAHAGRLTPGIFEGFARKLELDVVKFNTDMTHPDVAERVAADKREGERLGLLGTPFFVLDGRPFDGRFSDLLEQLKSTP
jgi:protein-disulfide isomerase